MSSRAGERRAGVAGAADSNVGGQRFGRIIDRQPDGSGPNGRMGTYFVRDDETETVYSFSYADIVTEGFRTIRTGERVRFLIDSINRDGNAMYPSTARLRVITIRSQIRLKPNSAPACE